MPAKTLPFIYREEILRTFFDYVKRGESFYIIGAPSAGKTRFLDLVLGNDPDALRVGSEYDQEWIKKKYLGEETASKVWLIRVDMNRITKGENWDFQFYELLLSSILLACTENRLTNNIDTIFGELTDLNSQVLNTNNELVAHRLLEIAIKRLCSIYKVRLCFLFDEFDETYHSMPLNTFAQLRAIRDANKYLVTYVLFLRNMPERLRPPKDNEGFFELISSRMIGLGLYSKQDTLAIIEKWEKRHEKHLSSEQQNWLWEYSGGHPGIAHVLFELITETKTDLIKQKNIEWFAKHETIFEEFRKLWIGLTKEEQAAMREIAKGNHPQMTSLLTKQLAAKGLLKPLSDHLAFFTPLFGYWLN